MSLNDSPTDATDATPIENPAARVTNRSEIVLLFDAENCNPNGNPMDNNRPRIDPVTGRCYVTDVCLKQYVRQQLNDDGHGVYILDREDEDGYKLARRGLVESLLGISSAEDVDEATFNDFLNRATDVRYFGAVMSIDGDDDVGEALRETFGENKQGPVQFATSQSLHPVEPNDETNSLTSVIATQSGEKKQGGFGLDDHRIKYGLFRGHGIVNEAIGDETGLMEVDVRRLDSVVWRALTNQTLSRSKFGHQPQFYLRAEYDAGHHPGDLHHGVTLDTGNQDPQSLRSIQESDEAAVAIDGLVEKLTATHDRLQAIHLTARPDLPLKYDGERATAGEMLTSTLREAVGEDTTIDAYDPYERAAQTMPEHTPPLAERAGFGGE
jgi:CRISPR-associated protein Csh2